MSKKDASKLKQSSAMIKVWLLLTHREYEEALERDEIIEELKDPDDKIYIPAYTWLRGIFRAKNPEFNARYPLLTWRTPRRPGRLILSNWNVEDQGFRVFCKIPRTTALFVNAEAWTCVVNQWYLPESNADDLEFEEAAPVGASSVDGLTSDTDRADGLMSDLEKKVRESWHRVFDLEGLKSEYGNRVYAFTDRIPISSIYHIEKFNPGALG